MGNTGLWEIQVDGRYRFMGDIGLWIKKRVHFKLWLRISDGENTRQGLGRVGWPNQTPGAASI